MRANDSSPSEIIDHIGKVIKERELKSLPTYYTISIEQYDKTTPVAEKEEGVENFKQRMLNYMSDYNLTSITIQLYHGKSRKVQTPFQTFKVPLKKQNPTVILGSIEKEPEQTVQQLDSSIPVGRYYDERFDWQMRYMTLQNEKNFLAERFSQLSERCDEKLKEQEKRYLEKIQDLEQKLQEKENLVQDFERDIIKQEKDKHNSFGNIALGSIGAHVLEGFIKGKAGTALLKGVLGDAGFQTMQNHLSGVDKEPSQLPAASNDRVISEPDPSDKRGIALQYIQRVAQALENSPLRMLYDIAELAAANPKDLEPLWRDAQEIKAARQQVRIRQEQSQAQAQTPSPEQPRPEPPLVFSNTILSNQVQDNESEGDEGEAGHDPEDEEPTTL